MVDGPKIELPAPENKDPERGPVDLAELGGPQLGESEAESQASEHRERGPVDLAELSDPQLAEVEAESRAWEHEVEGSVDLAELSGPQLAEVEARVAERRERGFVDLADLRRQVDEAEAEARASDHRALQLQAGARAARERAQLLRRQIQDEERRARGSDTMPSPGGLGRTLAGGMLAGAGAGATFALFIMMIDAFYGDSIFDWLNYSAAIALGRSVLQNDSIGVLLVGLCVHLGLAALYGAIFAVVARYSAFLRSHLITATAAFGLGLWMVNFYFFSPLLFPWFRDDIFVVQFIAHTLFFGVPLGIILLEFTPTGGILGRNQARA